MALVYSHKYTITAAVHAWCRGGFLGVSEPDHELLDAMLESERVLLSDLTARVAQAFVRVGMRIEVGILHEIDIQADLGFRHCNVVVDVIAQLLGEFVQKETFSTDSRLRQLLHLSPGLGCDTFRCCSLPQDGFCVRGLHGRWWVY
jgi:hypothetical protein